MSPPSARLCSPGGAALESFHPVVVAPAAVSLPLTGTCAEHVAGVFCFPGGQVLVETRVDKCGFSAGEPVRLQYRIANMSPQAVGTAYFWVEQSATVTTTVTDDAAQVPRGAACQSPPVRVEGPQKIVHFGKYGNPPLPARSGKGSGDAVTHTQWVEVEGGLEQPAAAAITARASGSLLKVEHLICVALNNPFHRLVAMPIALLVSAPGGGGDATPSTAAEGGEPASAVVVAPTCLLVPTASAAGAADPSAVVVSVA